MLTKVSYRAPPTISPRTPPKIVPTKGTGTKVPRADPIVAPTALAAALPTGSPDHNAKRKSTNPPMIGILPNTLPAILDPVLPKILPPLVVTFAFLLSEVFVSGFPRVLLSLVVTSTLSLNGNLRSGLPRVLPPLIVTLGFTPCLEPDTEGAFCFPLSPNPKSDPPIADIPAMRARFIKVFN